MYLRLTFWIVAMAYTAFLLARVNSNSSVGVMLTAAVFGAAIGLGLGAMFVNRTKRKHSWTDR